MGVDSAASATWWPPSSRTSTCGSHTRRVLVRVTWPWTPRCGLSSGIIFSMEHLEEWAEQKEQECTLNDLERDTEVVYRACIIRMQEDKVLADSKEAAAKDLPPERQVARAERQASATPRKDGVSSTSMSATLYPNWVLSRAGRCMSPDMPQPYRMPREDTGRCLTLEEEMDASSVFDPLQSSQGAEGPQTPPHYSETPTYIPRFDIAEMGMLPKMSPIADQENALLNQAPGSPVMRAAPPGLGWGKGGSGHSSCSGSPMSLGSPAVGSSLALAIKVCPNPGTPSTFGRWEELPRDAVEEEEEEMDAAENDNADQAKDWTQCNVHPAIVPCLARRRVEPADPTSGLGQPSEEKILCSSDRHALFGAPPNQTARFTQGHEIHSQRTLVVHRHV